jgi:hypothetical protein
MICPICEMDCGGTCEENDADKLSERRMLDREYQQSLRQETDPREWDDDFDPMSEYDPDEDASDDFDGDGEDAADEDIHGSQAGEDSDVAQGRFDDGE